MGSVKHQNKSDLDIVWRKVKRWAVVLRANGSTTTLLGISFSYEHNTLAGFRDLDLAISYVKSQWQQIDDQQKDALSKWVETLHEDIQTELSRQALFKQGIESVRKNDKINHGSNQKQSKPFKKHAGYVYLIKGVFNPPAYKIGYTKSPKSRVRRLDVVLPFPIDVIHLIEADHMKKVEAYLHNRYDHCRLNGEWFQLSEEEVAEICAIDEMNVEDLQ